MILKFKRKKSIQRKLRLTIVYRNGNEVSFLDQFIKNNFDFTSDTSNGSSHLILIASCIDKIYTADEVWSAADCTKKELVDFLEQMNSSQFKKLKIL
jgi:hypothetical protein